MKYMMRHKNCHFCSVWSLTFYLLIITGSYFTLVASPYIDTDDFKLHPSTIPRMDSNNQSFEKFNIRITI